MTNNSVTLAHDQYGLSSRIVNLRQSKIRDVANAGIGRDNVLPFWFGEPDEVTPAFIRDAANESIAKGETFYSHNLGVLELRETIARYLCELHPNPQWALSSDHIAVTSSGVNALSLAAQALIDPADRVVCVTPLWPNLVEIPKILSASVDCVSLRFDAKRGWYLDLDQLLGALTSRTKLLMINSPNNPTGWTLSRSEQQTILSHCRKHGIWIVADDAYERLVYADDVRAAPSFFDIADAPDRLVSANTFSKSWLMTGWRLGWLAAPKPLIEQLGKIIEYNTSCSPVFVQRAGIVAVRHGDATIAHTRERFRAARDHLTRLLNAIEGIEAPPAPGAMYAFFRVRGLTDSLAFCKRLVAEEGLGLAPGAAFGDEGEGFVRWCFASGLPRLEEGIERFRRGMAKR
ncbi:MAG: pyridoxal phosphate-dependent aminotransferase [Burkholderiales bacterium]|nr:MAG: pyridoxal phosphate-dependent aminotransferase [Betaproteobacteria bacterium]TAG80622.1 MAG: pyridoxal phosphate-dependent aminotransferase [Burkholderiales bacterium]